jgi:hypothetical protein
VELGLLTVSIEPADCEIVGWLEDSRKVERAAHVRIGWGQSPAENIKKARIKNRESSAKWRKAHPTGRR